MKIAHITPGLLPIPPKGWGAIEKMIWELHTTCLEEGHDSKIIYLDELTGDEDVVHIHVGNLANMAHQRGIKYYFTMSDHHTVLYGKDSPLYKENYEAMKNSIRSFVGGKFLVEYFDNIPEYSPYGVNTDFFHPLDKKTNINHKLLCVANNGYANNPAEDRKGFGIAIAAAKRLGLPITIAGPKNNQKYFDKNPPDYDKLTIQFDLSEEELLQTYRNHTIFLHPSQLETGHPNLTLLEALACGLPIVGTFEKNNSLNGMEIVNADADEVVSGIQKVMSNYEQYTGAALLQAEKLSWKNRAKELLTIYAKDKQPLEKNTMREQLVYHYSTLKKNVKSPQLKINHHNIDGMFVELLGGNSTDEYDVDFIRTDTNTVVYSVTLKQNTWGKANIKYFVNWKVRIKNKKTNVVQEIRTDLKNKQVLICFESKSLGDTLAWFPYVEEFRKQHQCQMICSTFWNYLFKEQYPHITFVEPGQQVNNIHALYRLGLFYKEGGLDYNMHPSNAIKEPMQKMASDILGLPFKEIRPQLNYEVVSKKQKQVCISIHSTAQAKYWNNPTGWQDVVDWLISRGYTVKLLSNEPDGYMGNATPTGVIRHPPGPIESVMEELAQSEAFIGLGSGLSWLSWSMQVPTVIISGFSYEWAEMTDCIRIAAPPDKCAGCFNRHRLDAGDWNWCPDHKNTPRQFECSKTITSDMVIQELEKILTI